MKSFTIVLALFAVFCYVQGQNTTAQNVCYNGNRTITNGMVTSTGYLGWICPNTTDCYHAKVSYQDGMDNVTYEVAGCWDYFPNTTTCEGIEFFVGVNGTTTMNCTELKCNTFACNNFSLPEGCSAAPPANDIQILPNCTLRTAMDQANSCGNTLLAGYPYADVATCSAKVDESFSCGINLMTTCLSGPCPTVLDPLPFDFRNLYKGLLNATQGISNLQTLLMLLNVTTEVSDLIMGAVCLQPDNIYLQMLQNITVDQLNLDNLTNPVCGSAAVNELFTLGLQAAKDVINANTHTDFCSTIINFAAYADNVWQNQCNQSAALGLLLPLFPAPYANLIPDIELALQIAQELFMSYVIPGCENITPAPITTSSSPITTTSSPISSTSSTTKPVIGTLPVDTTSAAPGRMNWMVHALQVLGMSLFAMIKL